MMFSEAVSGCTWHISRHDGQRFLCLRSDFTKHTRQKECPQGIEIGSQIRLKHKLHSKELWMLAFRISSFLSIRAILFAISLIVECQKNVRQEKETA